MVALIVIVGLVSFPIMAEEVHEDQKRHHVALFLGGTHAEGENEFTVGLDYSYRFHSLFGAGGLIDHAGGELDTTLIAPALFIYPFGGLSIVLAPGIEFNDDDNFAFRLGFAYEFEIMEKYTIAPESNLDFVDGETDEVYGIAFGIMF